MQYVKPKVHDETNYYNGVDLNDKEAVRKEFQRRRRNHTFFTLIFIIIFLALGVVAFDFYRVYKLEGKPFFATKKAVDGGTLYKGIGYEVLYCDNDERFMGAVLYKNCNDSEDEEQSFNKILYDGLMRFGEENELIVNKDLETLTINSFEFDEKNDKEGSDYLLDISLVCKDNKKCFKAPIEFKDPNNFKLILRLDKYNLPYDVVYFKESGNYHDMLVTNYQDKVKEYMLNNQMLDIGRLRSFKINLKEYYGKTKYKDIVYDSAYTISISYLCTDNSSDCVNAFDKKDDEGDFSNLYYLASMFIGEDDNVLLVGPRGNLS